MSVCLSCCQAWSIQDIGSHYQVQVLAFVLQGVSKMVARLHECHLELRVSSLRVNNERLQFRLQVFSVLPFNRRLRLRERRPVEAKAGGQSLRSCPAVFGQAFVHRRSE